MAQATRVDIADVVEKQDQRTIGVGRLKFPVDGTFSLSVFLLCFLVMVADGFDNQAINYAAPSIINEWGITRAMMTPVFTSSLIGWMLGAVLFSMLADRIGRRNTILLAVLLFGVFTAAVPLADNLVELGVIRFLSALGIGGGMPMAVALVSDYSRSSSRGFKITLLFIGYAIGASGGGFLAAELLAPFGWRGIFYLGGFGAVAVGVVLFFLLPESVRYLVLKGETQNRILDIARKLRPNANYDANTVFFIQDVKKKGLPLKYLFTEGRAAMTIYLWAAMALAAVTHFFMSAWLAALLAPESSATVEQIETAVRTKALFQAGSFTAFIFGWMLDKKGIPVMVIVLTLSALPVAAIGVTEVGTFWSIALAAISGLLVLGGGIGLNAIAGSVYPTSIRSTGTGAAFGAARIGAIVGQSIPGGLLAMDVSVPTIFTLMALPSVIAGFATFMIMKSMTPETAKMLASQPAMAGRH